MKNMYVMVVGFFFTILLVFGAQGAIFTLTYSGSNAAKAAVGGATYSLGSGQSITVNTGGLDAVYNIAWTETLVKGKDGQIKPGNSFDPDKDSLFENDFTLDFPQKINVWNVGGKFDIFGDGKYSYYFGINSGWQTVTGTAKQTAANRRGGW